MPHAVNKDIILFKSVNVILKLITQKDASILNAQLPYHVLGILG